MVKLTNEVDTTDGTFTGFVEGEVLSLVEKQCNIQLSKNPKDRAVLSTSNGGCVEKVWYGIDQIFGERLDVGRAHL